MLKVIVTVKSSGCLQRFWGPGHRLYLFFDLTPLTLVIPIFKNFAL